MRNARNHQDKPAQPKLVAPTVALSEAFNYDHVGKRLTTTRGATGSTTNCYVYLPANQTGTVPGYTPLYNNRPQEIHLGSLSGPLDSSFGYDDEGRLISQTGSIPRGDVAITSAQLVRAE